MMPLAPDRRILLLGATSMALTACSNIIGLPPSSQIYLLRNSAADADPGPRVSWSLAIAKPEASESLDTDRIALTRSNTEFDYYANAVWTDHLPDLIQTRMLSAFEATGRIDAIAREEDGFHADYKLLTDIRDFDAHYGNSKTTSPTVGVTIVGHAVNVHSHKIASSLVASSTRACTANTVNSVVEAFSVALTEVATRIVGWTLNLPAPATSQA